jgi:hypothetical protein
LTTWDKQCEHNLLTACLQTCCKMWDFYVCSKSANKPSTTCVSTYCPKLSTSLEQLVTTLLILLYLLQGCSNKSDTVMI